MQTHEHKPRRIEYGTFLFWNAIMFKHDCIHCNQKISVNTRYKVYSCIIWGMLATTFLIVLKYLNGMHNIEGALALVLIYFVGTAVNYVIFKNAVFRVIMQDIPKRARK